MKRCPKCGSEYPDAAVFCTADASPLSEAEAPGDSPQRVGERFELGERLGGGRTGPVYAARDLEADRGCVVKLVAGDVAPSELLRQRVERELKQLARLEDAAAARVLAHGRQEDALWVACERIEGVPLSEIVQEQPFSEERAAAAGRELSRALMTAAKLGVIHRDLSAKNVLVTPEGQQVLINFALPVPGDSHPGLPEFTSPEQIEGKPLDQRSNIYSLGALLYFAVRGRPPFGGTPKEVRAAHCGEELPEAPGISERFDAILVKALARSPSERYMTLRQVMDSFAAIVEEGAEGASQTMPMGRAGEEGSPHGKRSRKKKKGHKGSKGNEGEEQASGTIVGVPVLSKTSPAADKGEIASREADAGEGAGHGEAAVAGEVEGAEASAAGRGEEGAKASAAGGGELAVAGEVASAQGREQDTSSSEGAELGTVEIPEKAPEQAAEPGAGGVPLDALQGDDTVANPDAKRGAMVRGDEGTREEPQPAESETASSSADAGREGAGEDAETASSASSSSSAGGKHRQRNPGRERRSGRRFRETLWFKRGELSDPDEAADEAAAEALVEERYRDEADLSEVDEERYSLRTGSTQAMESLRHEGEGEAAEATEVSEEELLAEIRGGRTRLYVGIGAAVFVCAMVVVVALLV